MISENFPGGGNSNHPEVTGNLLETKHAEQVTLRHLLGVITDKSKDGFDRGDRLAADLHRPGENVGAATVYRFVEGADKNDPTRVGQIHISENVGTNGDSVITNYFILGTPDGLEIEKRGQTMNYNEMMLPLGATVDEIRAASLRGLQRVRETIATQAEEAELGLSFVSEQECRDLLTLLDDTEPVFYSVK